eukprot:1979350-Rhodomonas_salina.1
MQKRPDDEPFMEIKVQNKAGKTERVLMTLDSKRLARARIQATQCESVVATIDPNEIPATFDYT